MPAFTPGCTRGLLELGCRRHTAPDRDRYCRRCRLLRGDAAWPRPRRAGRHHGYTGGMMPYLDRRVIRSMPMAIATEPCR
jgi:hypothetical protein